MTGFVQSIITIVLFILILGALVIIHELGHFVTARLCQRPRPRVRDRLPAAGQGPAPQGRDALHAELAADRRLRQARGRGRRRRRRSALVRPPSGCPTKLLILVAGVVDERPPRLRHLHRHRPGSATPTIGVRVRRRSRPDSPAAAAGLAAGRRRSSAIDGELLPVLRPARRCSTPSATAPARRSTLGDRARRRRHDATSPSRCGRPAEIDAEQGALGIETLASHDVPRRSLHVRASPSAIRIGAERTVDALGLIVGGLGQLVDSIVNRPDRGRRRSPGPVGIATQIGDVFWQLGPIMTLYVAGILSANLAVVNILPFPPLDGGRMLMITLKRDLRDADQRPGRAADLHRRVRLPVRVPHLGHRLRHRPQPRRRSGRRELARTRSGRVAGRPSASTSAACSSGVAHPVVVQSMTNTDTADADATAIQVARLAHAGSQLVRVTVNTEAAAAAVPEMVRKVRGLGVDVPIIGDFHYNGHKLLAEYPEMAALLAKYRINPGNVGAKRHDEHFATIVRVAIDNDKPVRIGVNWGSLDQAILTELMDANAAAAEPRDARDVMIEAMLESAMRSAELAEATGHAPRPDHPVGQGVGRPRPRRRLPAARRPERLPAPPRPDRGRDGRQGDHRLDGRAGDPAQRGDRRHDPGLADARARRAARARGRGRPAGPPVDGPALVPAAGRRPARAAAGRPRRSSRRWPSRSRATSRTRCRSGARPTRAPRSCASRSWAASSTARARASTPTSGSACPGTFEEPVAPVFIDGRLDRTLRGDGLVAEFIEILEDYVARALPDTEPCPAAAGLGSSRVHAPGCILRAN